MTTTRGPATAAGRALLERTWTAAGVLTDNGRPLRDWVPTREEVLAIEAEAAPGLREALFAELLNFGYDFPPEVPGRITDAVMARLAAGPEQAALDERPGKHSYSALCTPVSDEFDDPWCYCDMHNYAEVTA